MKPFLKFMLIILPSLGGAEGGLLYAQKSAAPLAGQPLIDSLLKELPKQKEDTNKVNILDALSYAFRLIDPDEGIRYGEQEATLAAKLNWKRGMADANKDLGINYKSKSAYSKALAYLNEALKIDEEIGYKRGAAIVTGNMGNVYQAESDYPKALEYYFKALKMDEETMDKKYAANVTGNIGNVYENESDFPKALEYYFKALKMDEDIGNKNGEAIVSGNVGSVYAYQNDYPKALDYFFKAMKIDEVTGNKLNLASVTGNIGSIYHDQHNYTQAVAWHFKSAQMDEEIGDKNIEGVALGNIGADYFDIATHPGGAADAVKLAVASAELPPAPYSPGSEPAGLIPRGTQALLRKSVEYINKAIAIYKETGSLDYLQQYYQNLSLADSMLGDYKGAYLAHVQYSIFKDSVFNKENAVKIARLELRKKIEADSLKNEQARSLAELKYRQQRNYTYAGMAAIALLLALTFSIARNNKLLGKEKKRSEDLLLNILPGEVATELKDKGSSAARHYDNVTVLFTDFVNFTQASQSMSPQGLIDELHTCFKTFDEITEKYNIEKIKTIGDAYLAVAGLPAADPLHAEYIVRAAIEINAYMQDRLAKLGSSTFEIRIGIHSGSVVAGIVGVKKFAYDIWGDTVNTAARMEQNSEAGRINISATTYELVKDKCACEFRGEIEAKGKGMLKMYFIVD